MANVERVLNAMPEHEHQKHWDVSMWGEVTTCGTVAWNKEERDESFELLPTTD